MSEKTQPIVIGPVRFSYMSVFKPRLREKDGGEKVPEYSAVLLVPKKPNEFCPDPDGFRELLTHPKSEYPRQTACREGNRERSGSRSPYW